MNDIKSFKKNGNKNSLLNRQGLSWSEFNLKRKEEKKKWKEQKLISLVSEKEDKGKEEKSPMKKKKKKRLKQNVQSDKDSSILENSSKLNGYTISIAIPGSILDNAQTSALKTYLAGQIARAAAIFNVNEIIVFRETAFEVLDDRDDEKLLLQRKHHGCIQLLKILQYLECPQYLRKHYFPIQKDLEFAGILNPLDLPHHLRVQDESKYREGIVLNIPVNEGKGSFVNIGLNRPAIIDKILQADVRVTVQLDEEQNSTKYLKGKAVSPSHPFKHDNMYWGYTVRLAKGLNSVFSDSPYKGGYDLTIGTSERGQNVDSVEFPKFKHLLVVFGGLAGLEGCLEGDESISVDEPSKLFNYYLNTCPTQGSRTIRTEEAVLITMSALRPKIIQLQNAG